jgi:hypothetical protein
LSFFLIWALIISIQTSQSPKPVANHQITILQTIQLCKVGKCKCDYSHICNLTHFHHKLHGAVTLPVMKLCAFYATWRFITIFTTAFHQSLYITKQKYMLASNRVYPHFKCKYREKSPSIELSIYTFNTDTNIYY